MIYSVERANYDNAIYIMNNLRKQDIEEIEAFNCSPHSVIESFENSVETLVGLDSNGIPFVLFGHGVEHVLSDTAVIWAIGTDVINKYKTTFLRWGYGYTHELLTRYKILTNKVHVKNTLSIKFLKWLGFSFSEPKIHRITKEVYFDVRIGG